MDGEHGVCKNIPVEDGLRDAIKIVFPFISGTCSEHWHSALHVGNLYSVIGYAI